MDRCRCGEYRAAIDKLKFFIPGTYMPSYVDKYNSNGYTVCWVRHQLRCPYDSFTEARAWYSEPAVDPLSPEARMLEHMWCGEMSKYKGTRDPEPATGLEDQKHKAIFAADRVPDKTGLLDTKPVQKTGDQREIQKTQ